MKYVWTVSGEGFAAARLGPFKFATNRYNGRWHTTVAFLCHKKNMSFPVMPTQGQVVRAWERKRERLVDIITRRPVYYWRTSRDCDHCYSEWATKYNNVWEAEEAMESSYECAEGPESWTRISAEDYEEAKSQTASRDFIMEAHEDGHPHNVEY